MKTQGFRPSLMGISYYLIKHFGSTFQGIVYCNLGTPKTVISNFVTTRQIETPYSSPCKYGYPNDVPVGQKSV